jgi:uncharacterized protein
MKFVAALLSLFALFHTAASGQTVERERKYFDRNFRQETESEYISYYGYAKPLGNNIYEVEFFTMDGMRAATGEFKGRRLRQRHGVFVFYSFTGQILVTANYRKNVGHGVYQRFFLNGMLSDSGRLDRGNMTGEWKSWFDNGQLRETRFYELARGPWGHQVSYLEKEFKSWFANGKLNDSGYYRLSRREGIWIDWIEEGAVRSIGMYRRNWKKGLWRYYDASGKLLYMRRFSTFRYDSEGEYVPIARQIP